MDLMSKLKQVLPVSSRSFHSDINQLKSDVDEMQGQLTHIQSVLETVHHDVVHESAYYLFAEPGYPNYGDELIAREWIKYLAERCPTVPVYLDCARPGPAAAILEGLHPHLVVTDTVARLSHENTAAENDETTCSIASHVYDAIDDESQSARYAVGIRLIRNKTRGAHILGGGWLNSQWKENLARLAAVDWFRDNGIPAIGTGLGLVPLDEQDRDYVSKVLSKMNALSCRDTSSRQLLPADDNRFTLSVDDCFVNGLDGVYTSKTELPQVMICVQSDFVQDRDVLMKHVEAILQHWQIPENEEIGIVECMPYGDNSIFYYLRDIGRKVTLFSTQSLLDEGFPAVPGQLWISTRYHPHLLAAARGCSGVFISPDTAYYGVKHQAVLDMGSHWVNAAIGNPIPQAGNGFEHPDAMVRQYRDAVRASASALYGLSR